MERRLARQIYRFLFFIGKTGIVFDQATGLPVGVSGEAGFLQTISDFVHKKSSIFNYPAYYIGNDHIKS